MKNIHIIPTDKPSSLSYCDRHLVYSPTNIFTITNQNIYITSDEEIKDVRPVNGKWHLEKENILNKFPNYLTDLSECKLIILTTDEELIKDGVQAIDNEFLEWFVKNSTCEKIEVQKGLFNSNGKKVDIINAWKYYSTCVWYKIIIPKEKSKQETLEEAAENYGWRIKTNSFSNKVKANELVESAKQDFIEGAKWQAEKMYSEEQVKEIFYAGFNYAENKNENIPNFKQYFEQFKKK